MRGKPKKNHFPLKYAVCGGTDGRPTFRAPSFAPGRRLRFRYELKLRRARRYRSTEINPVETWPVERASLKRLSGLGPQFWYDSRLWGSEAANSVSKPCNIAFCKPITVWNRALINACSLPIVNTNHRGKLSTPAGYTSLYWWFSWGRSRDNFSFLAWKLGQGDVASCDIRGMQITIALTHIHILPHVLSYELIRV